ncbi:MAG: zinc-ribbon domain-containing protein [Myxococcaceae bacterium]
MIIACRQCQTRFKVPDGKVTARGLKVRCSRCGHTFRIYPDSAAEPGTDPAPAAVRPRTPDPFQAFGPDGTSDLEKTPARGTAVSALLAQMAPAPQPEDFDVDVAGVEAPGTEPAWNFPPAPSRADVAEALAEPPPSLVVSPAGVAIAVRAIPEPPSMDMGPLPVWPLPSAITAGHDPDLSDPFDASPYPEGEVPQPEPVPAPASAVDPHLATLAGFTPAWGVAAPVRALSVDGTLSNNAPSLSPAIEPESPPPEPQFGGAGTVLDDLPALEPAPALPPDGLELDPGDAARDWTGAAPAGYGGAQIELERDLASMDLDVGLPPTPPSPPADPDWSLPPPAIAPVAPAAASPGVAWDDPFAAAPSAPVFPEPVAPPPRAAPSDMSVILDEAPSAGLGGPEHGLFEMPGPGPAQAPGLSLLPDIPDAAEFGAATPMAPPGLAAPVPAISKPPSRARLGLQERELPGTARRVSGVILNVGLAALLLVVVAGLASSWVSGGHLDGSALSPRRLLQALRAGSGVSPVEIVPGTYETQSGRSLLYVRGRVLNRGAPAGRVRVRAEVWDGAQAVKAGETLAGAIATPEQLWRAATPADVEALRASLLAAAKPVSDGQGADFLVLLDDAPRDLAGLRLQITASIER